MTKDVLLRIRGLQIIGEGEEEPIEVIAPGTYFEKNGKHYIKYDEVLEGFEGTVQNLIKVDKSSMEVTKRGVANVHMVFEENKKNLSYYNTPFGNLLVGISATDIVLDAREDSMDIRVDYALEVNYEHLADCSISMNVQAKKEHICCPDRCAPECLSMQRSCQWQLLCIIWKFYFSFLRKSPVSSAVLSQGIRGCPLRR